MALARKFWYTQPGRANAACRCWHGRSWYRTNFDFLGIQPTCQEGKVHLPAIWQVKQPKFQNFTCLLAFGQPPAYSGPVPNSVRRTDNRSGITHLLRQPRASTAGPSSMACSSNSSETTLKKRTGPTTVHTKGQDGPGRVGRRSCDPWETMRRTLVDTVVLRELKKTHKCNGSPIDDDRDRKTSSSVTPF